MERKEKPQKNYRVTARCMRWILLVFVSQGLLILLNPWGKTAEMRQTSGVTATSVTSKRKEAESSANKPRLNVIILTHMSSGSTFLGNVFNLHPDVFYLFEPLNELRMIVYGDGKNLGEWNVLDEKAEEAYRTDFSNLLRDFVTCSFIRDNTIDYLFPLRVKRWEHFQAWRSTDTKFTKESIREVCNSRKITVAKIMQTRLPGEIGIRELQRVCSSEPHKYECLIIHFVRDPRAVILSLITRGFHMPFGPMRKLITTKNTPRDGKEMIRHNSDILCSEVEVNLNYVNEEWSKWFKGRYVLARYEDTPANLLKAVLFMYNFTGLPMVTSISKWIREGIRPPGVTINSPTYNGNSFKKNDVRIEHWRLHLDNIQVSEFEEGCWPMMHMMGYISINANERLLHDTSQKLWTDEIPFPFPR